MLTRELSKSYTMGKKILTRAGVAGAQHTNIACAVLEHEAEAS